MISFFNERFFSSSTHLVCCLQGRIIAKGTAWIWIITNNCSPIFLFLSFQTKTFRELVLFVPFSPFSLFIQNQRLPQKTSLLIGEYPIRGILHFSKHMMDKYQALVSEWVVLWGFFIWSVGQWFFNYWVAGEKRLVLSCECDFYNSSDEQNLQTWATKMAISCLFKSILSTDKVILLQKLDSCKQTNTPPERLAYILKVQTPPNFRLTTQHNLFSLHCVQRQHCQFSHFNHC